MVAEAEAPPAKKSHKSVATGGPGRRRSIPVPVQLKARNLYVIQQIPADEVALQTGLTRTQIEGLAARLGWGTLRKQGRKALTAPLQARELAELDEIGRAAASLSDEGLLGSLMRANQATVDKGPMASKDAQAFASAARSLMQVGRTLRGLDNAKPGDGGNTTNLIFVNAVERLQSEKPCIDVSTTESASPALPEVKADASTHS